MQEIPGLRTAAVYVALFLPLEKLISRHIYGGHILEKSEALINSTCVFGGRLFLSVFVLDIGYIVQKCEGLHDMEMKIYFVIDDNYGSIIDDCEGQ